MSALFLPNYDAEVKHNSTVIPDWNGFRVESKIGFAEHQFTIQLNRPINVVENDTVTIKDGFGTDLYTLVDGKVIESTGMSFMRAELSGAGSTLTRKAPSKTRIYVNKEYLDKTAPGNYVKDGIIFTSNPGTTPYKVQGVSKLRLFMDGLPGKDVQDYEFECIVSNGITHHDIGRYICSQIGFAFVSNTPNLKVQKTFTLNSNQSYWNSLVQMFAIWKPQIFVRTTNCYVFDVGGDRQAKQGSNCLNFTEDSFEGYDWREEKELDIVDHVLVVGPNVQYVAVRKDDDEAERKSYSETSLSGETVTETHTAIESFDSDSATDDPDDGDVQADDVEAKVEFFSAYEASKQWRIAKTVTEREMKINPQNPDQQVVIKETITQYADPTGLAVSKYSLDSDSIMHLTQTTYGYADFNTPVRCTVQEHGRIPKIAGGIDKVINGGKYQEVASEMEYVHLSKKVIKYGDRLTGGLVETDEKHFGLVVYNKEKVKYQGNYYWSNTNPQEVRWSMMSQVNHCEANNAQGEGFDHVFQLVRHEKTEYDEASKTHIRKKKSITTYFPFRVTRTIYEDISLPEKPDKASSWEMPQKWEFFDIAGTCTYWSGATDPPVGNFHPKVTISHPDIIDQDTAAKVAGRAMNSKQKSNKTISIKSVVPIPGIMVGQTATLPTCTKKFLNWTTKQYEDITIAAGTYWIVGHTRQAQYAGNPGASQRELKVFDIIELKKYY